MAALDDEFEFVAASVERAANLQRGVIADALEADTVRNPRLLQHLVAAYDAVLAHVAQRRLDYAAAADDVVRRSAIVEMRELVWSVRDMQSNLPWVEAARRNVLDLGSTFWLERLARDTIDPNAEVTVIATDHPSYATQTNPWRPLITDFGLGIAADEPPVVVVHIPRREQHSGLLHPLIVHELGHAIDSQHDVVLDIWRAISTRTPFQRRFTRAVTMYGAAEGLSTGEAAHYVARRLVYWITESFCDSLAASRLGPTYLYSFLAEVAAGTIDDAGEKHPPARERVALISEQLVAAGWGDSMAAADPMLDQWVNDQLAVRPPHLGVAGFLVWATGYVKAVVRRHARAAIGGSVLTPAAAGLGEAIELLAAGIPPAQQASGQSIAPEVVILACWYSALAASGGGPTALPNAADAPQLATVLPAALELCAVVESWSVV